MRYFVELECNESQLYKDEVQTANFNIPEVLEKFEIYAEKLDEAVQIAFGYLQGLTETPFDGITYNHKQKESASISFNNYEDDLGITYSITRRAPKPYDFVCQLPQELQDLILWRLRDNGITDEEDIEHAMNSRVSSLEDAIDISDIFCGEDINKCTFCGKVDFAGTKQINGYSILSTCTTCEQEIFE